MLSAPTNRARPKRQRVADFREMARRRRSVIASLEAGRSTNAPDLAALLRIDDRAGDEIGQPVGRLGIVGVAESYREVTLLHCEGEDLYLRNRDTEREKLTPVLRITRVSRDSRAGPEHEDLLQEDRGCSRLTARSCKGA